MADSRGVCGDGAGAGMTVRPPLSRVCGQVILPALTPGPAAVDKICR
jgi:hypothetical protein